MILLIKNGHVINPATETDEVADILAEDGKVVKMEKNIKAKADRVIDAKGCYVMPGFIDMHVHLRDPGQEQKETIETGCNAAAHGGYTTILAMPNTRPVVDNPDVVKYVQIKQNSWCRECFTGGSHHKRTAGKRISRYPGHVRSGNSGDQ